MGTYKDLTGQKFGRLIVLKQVGRDKNNQVIWLCQCECGNTIKTISNRLKMGKTKSCGCLAKEIKSITHKTHGLSHTRLNRIYRKMKGRCLCKTNPAYPRYGGRGIKICVEWLDNFMNFYNWAINNGYADNLSIDRINVNGNYEPSNCRWATDKIQTRNLRTNHLVTYKGETRCIAEWAEILKIKYSTILQRINKLKWSAEKAFETPIMEVKKCS